jgi:hypothetical protein
MTRKWNTKKNNVATVCHTEYTEQKQNSRGQLEGSRGHEHWPQTAAAVSKLRQLLPQQ